MQRAPALVGLTHLRALAITLVLLFHYRLFEHPAWVDYLTHKACIHVVQRALAKTGLAVAGNTMFVCCIVASLSVAWALHLAVERPLLRWRDRVLRARAG